MKRNQDHDKTKRVSLDVSRPHNCALVTYAMGLKVILFTFWVDVGGGGKRVYEGGQQEGRVTERERGKASSFYCLLALSFARLPKMEERERKINPESPPQIRIRVMVKHD